MRLSFQRLYNRLEFNQHLNNKKALYINMKNFYETCSSISVFETLPVTFHIKNGWEDPSYDAFNDYYQKQEDSPN